MVKPIIHVNRKKAADIPNVPNAIDLRKPQMLHVDRTPASRAFSDSARLCFAARYAQGPHRLRSAFNSTMKDPEFLAEMKKSKLEINPLTVGEMDTIVNKLFQMGPQERRKSPRCAGPEELESTEQPCTNKF